MSFELICEIEPPTRPDLQKVRHQIGALSPVAHSFLIPDNHIGRATVSSIAVAHEVAAMGGRAIACLNARDRNLLGLRRDLLTAAAYGVDSMLFVYGDKPASGNRTGELTVRAMIEEARVFAAEGGFPAGATPRLGVAAGAGKLPSWKRAADFAMTQISYSVEDLLRWRDRTGLDMPVYAGVMVLASAKHVELVRSRIPDIRIPGELADRVGRDPAAGVEAACEQVLRLRDSGAFDGVHLIPVARYREVALRLEAELSPLRPAGRPLPGRTHPARP